MAQLHAFDLSSLDTSVEPPMIAFLSGSIGAFRLSGSSGQAIFVWYHEGGDLDVHSHALTYKGTGKLGGTEVVAYAPAEAGQEGHGHDLFLFTRKSQSPHEGHRVFYVAHGHVHLWASDVRCLPLHD